MRPEDVHAGNLLSALRGLIRWMIDEEHLEDDDDPTIGLKSGKAKASRESGGFVPWTEDDMMLYRTKWPLGTEARLMFDILHYTFLRVGDAHRFGPPHLRQIVRKMAVQIATEKSRGNTTVTVPVHPEFADSLRAARAAGIIGAEVFTVNLLAAVYACLEITGKTMPVFGGTFLPVSWKRSGLVE